jgi:hypothetical protein
MLPALKQDGSPVYGVGEISQEGVTIAVDPDGVESTELVYDTDRWLVDLLNFLNG